MNIRTLLVALGTLTFLAGCETMQQDGEDDETETLEDEQPIAGEACDEEGEQAACEDEPGTQTCLLVYDEKGNSSLEWSDCVVDATSTSVSTPLVLAFDDEAVSFTRAPGSFAIDGRMSVATDWVSASTPWLALDRNGNGAIDGGAELFGSATPLGEGLAPHGFAALAELDADGDRRIAGAELDALLVWADADQNRVSDAAEIVSATSLGLVAIELDYSVAKVCDARGNCEKETARFSYATASGATREGRVVDVYLRHQ